MKTEPPMDDETNSNEESTEKLIVKLEFWVASLKILVYGIELIIASLQLQQFEKDSVDDEGTDDFSKSSKSASTENTSGVENKIAALQAQVEQLTKRMNRIDGF